MEFLEKVVQSGNGRNKLVQRCFLDSEECHECEAVDSLVGSFEST